MLQKKDKGFTLAEMIVTMAVISIFIAVTISIFSMGKTFETNDRNAYKCVVTENANLSSSACIAILDKCKRNESNSCGSIKSLATGSTETAALSVLDEVCSTGGKTACDILVNRCIDNADNCHTCTDNQTYCAADSSDYNIHKYLDMNMDSSNLAGIP